MSGNVLYHVHLADQDELLDFCEEMFGDIATFTKDSDGRSVVPHTKDWATFYKRMELMMSDDGMPDMDETAHAKKMREWLLMKELTGVPTKSG